MGHEAMDIEEVISEEDVKEAMKQPSMFGVDWSNNVHKARVKTIEINKLDMSIVQEGVSGGDFFDVNIEFSTGAFTDAVEEELEERIDEAIIEVLRGCCFSCNARKTYDEVNEEYYCPICDL